VPDQTIEAERPIEDYGLIGDTRTAALVASDGSIDWLCVPRFDSDPIFGRLVGGPAAGRFRMGPAGPAEVIDRSYRTETATLTTTWATPTGRLTLAEAMVSDVTGHRLPSALLVRTLTASGGPVDAMIDFDPQRGGIARRSRVDAGGRVVVCSWKSLAIAVTCSPPTTIEPGRPQVITLGSDDQVTVAIALADREPLIFVPADQAWALVEREEQRWRAWCSTIESGLPCREVVVRSLLTLRLLTYSPSGAPVAAPTTSLPEDVGGVRNWDYRFAWPRDASIGIAAFLGAGKDVEARHFLAWLVHATRLERPRLPVLLTLHGRRPGAERDLDGWPGYRSSRPVRVGNGAADQHQLDGYGWVLDAASLLVSSGHRLYSDTWRALRGFADEVATNWREPDAGIWEIRGDEAHHVHSKLMAWLALDRALHIAETHRTSASRRARWLRERDAVGMEIRSAGFDTELGAYTRSYASTDFDAATLVLAHLGLEPVESGRVRATVDAVRRNLSAGGPLLYRYRPGDDGLPGGEGAFLPCSFWLVQALAMTGEVTEAERVFDELIGHGGPLSLFPEELDPATGAFLGNFPQALTHSTLVGAALAIRDASAARMRLATE
jgi:GH15 family glucan-1,4-alpha-glucosidase